MSLTPSTMMLLGTQAPDFNLKCLASGKSLSLASFEDKQALFVMFICCHCPYVIHVKSQLAKLGNEFVERGVGVIAISSNDVKNYPQDGPAKLLAMAKQLGFKFPICHDADQSVAKHFAAACTPDFFLFNQDRKLVYRGQMDDSRPENGKPVTGKDLRAALDALLAGRPVTSDQKPSLGCNIKWTPGNEPAYFAR